MIYLQPVTRAYSNHKYDTTDYKELDVAGSVEAHSLRPRRSMVRMRTSRSSWMGCMRRA